MSDLTGVKVGDTLVMLGYQKRDLVRVTKVGRKLLSLEYAHRGYAVKDQYRIENGEVNDNYGNSFLRTIEDDAKIAGRMDLEKRLREGGLNFRDAGSSTRIDDTKLRAIVNILESD